MAGTFVKDGLRTDLLDGLNFTTTATEQLGTALQVNSPLYALFTLSVVDPNASNDATMRVGIQGCETSNFSTSDVVEIAYFDLLTEAALVTDGATTTVGAEYQLGPICVDTKFIRASMTIDDGTSGDFTGSTLHMDAPYFQRGVHFNDSTSNASQPSAGHKS